MASVEELQRSVGQELGVSDWLLIDQDRVDQFGHATLDLSFTHVDPVRAAPYGGTTAHGLLILSLAPYLVGNHAALPEGCEVGLNYGFDRVRITSPVPVGARIRMRTRLAGFERQGEAWWKRTLALTVEVEGQDKAALHANWMVVYR